MPRTTTGAPRVLRRARALAYGTSRTLGNAQPFVDFLGNGDLAHLGLNVGRRYVRRFAGSLFSRSEFGRGSILGGILGLLVGRLVGSIGRR